MRPSLPSCLLASLALTGAGGCVNHVYSPPARTLPLETAATLAPHRHALALEGSGHGAMFGPSLESGTLRYRQGVAPGLEVEAEGSAMYVDEQTSANTNHMIYAGRLGFRHPFGRYVAASVGLGGGFDAAGAFFSPDMGGVVAWENPYLVPFFSLRGFLSLPIAARAVDTSKADNPPGTQINTPSNTIGLNLTLGLRVPIGRCDDPRAVCGSIAGGLGFAGAGRLEPGLGLHVARRERRDRVLRRRREASVARVCGRPATDLDPRGAIPKTVHAATRSTGTR